MSVFSRKYRAVSVESKMDNPLHETVRGAVCYLAYLKVGMRGWFIVDDGYEVQGHRVHTSTVKKVTEEGNRVIVETKNTVYTFELIEEE